MKQCLSIPLVYWALPIPIVVGSDIIEKFLNRPVRGHSPGLVEEVMRRGVYWIVIALLALGSLLVYGQDADSKVDLQNKLGSQFVLTKLTADKSDIVSAGSILALQKDGLLMYELASPMPPMNTYKNGKIGQGWSGFGRDIGITLLASGNNTAANYHRRRFVAGEKFWVTGYTLQNDGILFQFYSDPYDDVRYYGQLKLPFPKGHMPPADKVMSMIAEVLTVQPNEAEPAAQQPPPQTAAQAPEAAQEQALAPIAPPPPPADTPPPPPKTIAIGQTRDQVMAILGQPQKVVKLPTKEMLYYPDMKVILVKAKVTDVQ